MWMKNSFLCFFILFMAITQINYSKTIEKCSTLQNLILIYLFILWVGYLNTIRGVCEFSHAFFTTGKSILECLGSARFLQGFETPALFSARNRWEKSTGVSKPCKYCTNTSHSEIIFTLETIKNVKWL